MKKETVLNIKPLGVRWECLDPFLFCVYHLDAYPKGNDVLGPATSLAGRNIGMDFEGIDGWRLYHGDVVPGFPRHPHRGFETVTIARRGLIDHSDSLGATARYGEGDVQWMTAGQGIVHAEMFPLLDADGPNPLELFQIWLNLPGEDKMVAPHFKMLWGQDIPTVSARDEAGRETRVTVIAGRLDGAAPPSPPPKSWAARPDSEVAIWTLRMAPEARWALPPVKEGVNRTLYWFRGTALQIGGESIPPNSAVELRGGAEAVLQNGAEESELLLLQGRPIGEPVAQHGPFVMNSRAELMQAFEDYQRTGFGGWPWPSDSHVHPVGEGRHAQHPDGRLERGG